MDRAIEECDRVLAVLSPDYVASLFTRPEWAAYFKEDHTSEQRQILPVRVREYKVKKGLLAAIVYVDLVGKEEADASVLLDGVKIGRRKPTSAPSFPSRRTSAIESRPQFPGALPPVWNIPHLRNPNFTEPGERLTELRDALRTGHPAALAGLGGVGKTQLATEYAYLVFERLRGGLVATCGPADHAGV